MSILNFNMDLAFSKPCRACKCNVERKEINSSYIDMFAFCTSIKVLKNDILSVYFCDKCALKLVQCFKFIKKCLKTDKELRATCYGNILNTSVEKINDLKVKKENVSDEDEQNNFDEEFNENSSSRIIHDNLNKLVKYESEELQIEYKVQSNDVSELERKEKYDLRSKTKPAKKKRARQKYLETYKGEIFSLDKYEPKKNLYSCPVCQMTYSNIKLLDHHLKNVHPDYRKYKCHICSKGFRYPAAMQMHFNKHSNLKKYECDVCHKFYKFKGALKIHVQSHIFGKHECNKCQKSFESLPALKNHTVLHKGHKPHLCDTCGQGFALVTNLKVHMRIHSGERPYSCHVCPYTASFYAAFRRHELSHTRSGRKPCATCGKDFADLGSLKRHTRLHTGDLPYKCDYCQMGFIDGWKRRVHIAKWHNIALADIPHLAQRRNTTQVLPDSDEDIK